MTRLLRISVSCFFGLLSCRGGSAGGQGDRGSPASSESQTSSHASASASAPASPNVCSAISADDVAAIYHLPVTKSQGITSGARCDYTSSHGMEVFISLLIWHGVHPDSGIKQDPRGYMTDIRSRRGMGRVFGPLHPISGVGDDALWAAFALVLTPGHEPTAPTNVQVLVRRGDSLVSVIRPLPEAEATNEAYQEEMANNAKAVLPKLLALLGT